MEFIVFWQIQGACLRLDSIPGNKSVIGLSEHALQEHYTAALSDSGFITVKACTERLSVQKKMLLLQRQVEVSD